MNQNTLQCRRSLLPKQTYPPPLKMEVPALLLDTSSQASVPETEASIESNPIQDSPTAVANSSHSDSPTMDLLELQASTHLAINHMLSIKRSSELKRQWEIWDLRCHCTSGKLKQLLPMKEPRLSTQGKISKPG